jgi:isoleucyl-tRNA synthetase
VSLPGEAAAYAVIWTTTPWTLPANEAVSVHPEFEYLLLHTAKGYLVLAAELAEACLARYGMAEGSAIAGACKGAALENLPLQHPFYERIVPVICGEHVTLEAGTGLVHTAPAHGLDDYFVGQKYGLPNDNPVGDDGRFISTTHAIGESPLAGVLVWDSNNIVLNALHASGNLLHQEKLKHSYPHCWRHKTPIIFRSTPQWFIGMEQGGQGATLRELANHAVEETEFFPKWGRARLEAMIRNRPDWCVSRQRSWGVPMPFFVHRETMQLHPRTPELLEAVAQRVEQDGIEAWFDLNSVDLLGDDAEHYRKLNDTLDVWFDSGVTHYTVMRKRSELGYPADLYLEGSDQHRGWFQSSLLTGCAIDGRAPYRQLLTHGFTVDEKGYKMSKSRGNGIEPQDICNKLGADMLRLWIASTDYSGEMSLSEEILKRVTDSYRRIRNTLRFLLANVGDFDADKHALPVEQWLEIDRYALQLMQDLQIKVQADYEHYEFHLVVQKLQQFCSEDLGGFYLDILKDRLYTSGENSSARRSAQNALYHITHGLARLMAPILSFTGEEVWAVLAGNNEASVFEQQWYVLPEAGLDAAASNAWFEVCRVRELVNKKLEEQRAAGVIGSALAADVEVHASGATWEALARLGDDLKFVFITSSVVLHRREEGPLDIFVSASKHAKCGRCWHYREDVGSNAEHPTLCDRCVSNLFGEGEARHYA